MRNLLLTIGLFFGFLSVEAQDLSLLRIPFFHGDAQVFSPYTGGLRSPQFSTVDLNLDGVEDVIVFDKDGNVFIPMIRTDDNLVFDPRYRGILPEVNSWVQFRDYNNDGIKDIFCAPIEVGLPGVEVYKGSIRNDSLIYNLVRFPERDFDILYFPIGSTFTQVFVSVIDIPEIRDVDNDGDLDIIAFEPTGFSAYFYRNLSVEEGFSTDTLIYVLEDNCYGGFIESGFSQDVTLSPDPGVCASFLIPPDQIPARLRHSGSTVLSYDLTGNGLHDLLLGDISFNSLVMLTNGGSLDLAHFTDQEVMFGTMDDQPVSIELYLNAFIDDFDNDGHEELIVSPHERFGAQTKDHIWKYRINNTSDTSKSFTLIQKDFIIDETIYPGTLTVPEFFDENNDGLMDLMIGTEGLSEDGIAIDPRIYLYHNTGTERVPVFTLATDDYLGLSAFSTTSSSFAPSIGDIDGDGDQDMVVGDNSGALYYLENTSNDGTFAFANAVYEAFDIRVGAHARPEIFDANNDGLGDLVIGEQNFNSVDGEIGSLNYFENIGSVGNPAFNPDVTQAPNDPLFGAVNLREEGFINNHSTPAIVEKGEEIYFITGSDQGYLHYYTFDKESYREPFELITSRLGQVREGARTAIDFDDIDADGFAEIVIGSRRGGIAIYNSGIQLEFVPSVPLVASDEGFVLSPNPVSHTLRVEHSDRDVSILDYAIYNLKGEKVTELRNGSSTIDVSTLANGIYIIEMRIDDLVVSDRFFKVD